MHLTSENLKKSEGGLIKNNFLLKNFITEYLSYEKVESFLFFQKYRLSRKMNALTCFKFRDTLKLKKLSQCFILNLHTFSVV